MHLTREHYDGLLFPKELYLYEGIEGSGHFTEVSGARSSHRVSLALAFCKVGFDDLMGDHQSEASALMVIKNSHDIIRLSHCWDDVKKENGHFHVDGNLLLSGDPLRDKFKMIAGFPLDQDTETRVIHPKRMTKYPISLEHRSATTPSNKERTSYLPDVAFGW